MLDCKRLEGKDFHLAFSFADFQVSRTVPGYVNNNAY